jgi:hypothetical protein
MLELKTLFQIQVLKFSKYALCEYAVVIMEVQ